MPLQVKETGTPVDFTNARDIDMQKYTFQDDFFGVYAYQGTPVMVDATTRDNFANGNLNDLQNQATEQGMPIQYIRISWNETYYGMVQGYLITDLVVGVVSRGARIFNIGPTYLVNALKAIGWFNQLISKVSMPWKAWELLQTPNRTESFNRWNWDAISAPWSKSAPIGQPIPDPPATSEVVSHFVSEGKVSEALGKFVQEIIDKGFQCTVLSYKVQVCYERRPIPSTGYYHGYQYRTHTRLSIDFQTNAEVLDPFFTPIVIVALGKIIALIIAALLVGAGIYFALQNLTTTEETYEKWEWVQNPDTGDWEWKPVETGSKKAPPDWWGTVFTIVGIVGVIVVAAVVVPKLIPQRQRQKR